jgi:hypothetical protein
VQKQGESRLKNVSVSALFPIGGVAVVLLTVLMLRGVVWVSGKVLPWLFAASEYTIGICIFILLPLCIFRKARPYVGVAFVWASLVFGAVLFAYSCVFVVNVWGYGGLAIGLIFAGVGVVPLALLAALVHAQWSSLFDLSLQIVLMFGTRFLGAWLSEIRPEEPEVLMPDGL